ncbi:hypothetical protein FACS1894132_05830 [Clostridia bacterium]|nr:hypothetical protein FACS1894132_05830 [Clostridia bacterium]
MDWTQIIITSVTVLGGSGSVLAAMFNNSKKHNKKHEKTDFEIENIRRQNELIISKYSELEVYIDKIENDIVNQNYATKKQIKYTLTRIHREVTENGFITRYILECAEDLYTEYKNLQGNSFIDKIMSEIRELPTKAMESEK